MLPPRPLAPALFLCGVLTLLSACQEPAIEEQATRVVVVPVAQEDVTLFGNYVGQTQPSKQVEVNPRVDGFLEEIAFVEGSVVTARQVLYRIDAAPYEASVDRHRAILSSRVAALAKARRDLARIKPLFEENAASQLDYDDAISAVQQLSLIHI